MKLFNLEDLLFMEFAPIVIWGYLNIALIFMLLDHIHTYLHIGPRWISLLPRFVAPLFVFFLVEGFNYYKNRKRYLGRLFSAF